MEQADSNPKKGVSVSYISEQLAPFSKIYSLPQLHYWPHFLRSVDRIAKGVDWLSPYLPGSWASPAWRESTLLELQSKIEGTKLARLSPYKGARFHSEILKYGLFSAILDKEPSPSKHIEQLSAALILTVLHLDSNGENDVEEKIKHLASAIRALRAKRNTNSLRCLEDLKDCKDPLEVSKMFAPEEGVMVAFTQQWMASVMPALTESTKMPGGEPIGPDIEIIDEPDTIWDEIDDDEDNGLDSNKYYLPIEGGNQPEIGEPASELSPSVSIVDIYVASDNATDLRLEKYRAGQRIWSGNHLLIQSHSAVLPVKLYRSVTWELISGLEKSHNQNIKNALLAFLLSGLTGRAERALTKIWVTERVNQNEDVGDKALICLATGVLYQSAITPESAFRQNEISSKYLEPTFEIFAVPLPIRLIDILRKETNWRGKLFDDTEKTQKKLFTACSWVSERLQRKICRAEYRKAFAPAIFETCRDVAQVMHICSDTLGLSSSPLYYYAPRRAQLANTYSKAMDIHLGLRCNSVPEGLQHGRIGSQLLLKQDESVRITEFLPSNKNQAQDSEHDIALTHNNIVQHIVSQLIFISGHRVCNAVYSVVIGDIDIEVGCAIFSDKKIDAAHATRLVGIPPIVADQFNLYYEHLKALAQLVPKLSKNIAKIFSGEAPLLFGLDEKCKPCRLDIANWKEGLNKNRPNLPLNWSRTYIKTRGCELGGDPEALTIQLGHLEAIGYPFSGCSPTEPLSFLSKVNPVLQRLAKDAGWRLRFGLVTEKRRKGSDLTRLENWDERIRIHETSSRRMETEHKLRLRAGIKSAKDQAIINVIAIIINDRPDIAAALVPLNKMQLNIIESPAQAMIDEWVNRISAETGNDIALKIASHRVLRSYLKKVEKYCIGKIVLPALPFSISRPMDSPFIHGMMIAVRQIQAIRDDLSSEARQSDSNMLFARVAIGLVVAGQIENTEQILGILNNCSKLQRINSMKEYILVPYGLKNHEVIGLYGYAAIGVERLARTMCNAPVPCLRDLEQMVARELPQNIVASPKTALTDLCSTMKIVNRLELSPLARTSNSLESGSRSAPIDQQVAFLDNCQWKSAPIGDQNTIESLSSSVVSLKPAKTNNIDWKHSYQALLDIIPSTTRNAKYKEADHFVEMSKSNSKAAYDSTIYALNVFIDNQGESRNVRVLAVWARDMLVNGTLRRKRPAYSTVMTYLTAIARPLISQCNGVYLAEMADFELESLYQSVVESRPRHDQSDVARHLLNFHDCLMRSFGAPDIDESLIAIYISARTDSVDNQLVLPVHVEEVLSKIHMDLDSRNHEQPINDIAEYRRTLHLTLSMLSVIRATAARLGELQGALLLDLTASDQGCFLRIHSNKHRRLKTAAAQRVIDFTSRFNYNDQFELSEWLAAEKSTTPKHKLRNAFIMSNAEDRQFLDLKASVYIHALEYLRKATGRKGERIHRLRHLVVMESIIMLCIHDKYKKPLAHLNSMILPVDVDQTNMLMPWHLQSQTDLFGHTLPSIAIRSYFHMPWILKTRSDQRLQGLVNRRNIARLYGVTMGAIDQMFNKCSPDERIATLLGDIQKVRTKKMFPNKINIISDGRHELKCSQSQLSYRSIHGFIVMASTYGNIKSAALSYGIHPSDLELLIKCIKLLHAKSGYRLLSIDADGRFDKKTRKYVALSDMDYLLDCMDGHGADDFRKIISDMSHEIFEWSSFKHNIKLRVRNEDVTRFSDIIRRVGCDIVINGEESNDLLTAFSVVNHNKRIVHANRYLSELLATIYVGQSLRVSQEVAL